MTAAPAPDARAFLRALADLLEQHQATLGYSTYDRGVEISVAGVEVAAVWCLDPDSGAAELREAAAGGSRTTPPVPNFYKPTHNARTGENPWQDEN